jgi:hypothetical protein
MVQLLHHKPALHKNEYQTLILRYKINKGALWSSIAARAK